MDIVWIALLTGPVLIIPCGIGGLYVWWQERRYMAGKSSHVYDETPERKAAKEAQWASFSASLDKIRNTPTLPPAGTPAVTASRAVLPRLLCPHPQTTGPPDGQPP